MHPKQLHKRLVSAEASSHIISFSGTDESFNSLRDEAALLLSIADVARSELTSFPSALSDYEGHEAPRSLPKFPVLISKSEDSKLTAPRTESLRGLLYLPSGGANATMGTSSSRLRAVSIDSPHLQHRIPPRTPSPLASPPLLATAVPITPNTPKPSVRFTHRSSRLSIKARHIQVAKPVNKSLEQEEKDEGLASPTTPCKSKPLQAPIAKGVSVKKIYRKKFSWKVRQSWVFSESIPIIEL